MIRNDIKNDFPVFLNNSGIVYLDNSATTQKPQSVIDAVSRYYEYDNANPLRGLYSLSIRATDDYEDAREAVRRFIGADSVKEIIFTRNTSESLNLISYSYAENNLKEGDEVLVSILEHHSDLLPWQRVTRKTGAKLRFVDCDEEGLITEEAFRAALTDRTKIVAMTHVSNVLGVKNDIKKFAEIAHERGAVFVCDGAQSTPHMKIDVKDLDVDFFAFSGHKMLGPMGIGVLYAKEEILEEMDPFLYGGEMIDCVTRLSATYAELPHKFEAGTVNAGGACGLKAAIDYYNSI
ncbi:MAG: cysteine desulfurase, partial [Oscillospiraceae bacterium]|nr:cysteine desulfurase [Oscillospiraceae bacterium]